jgi:hypothetical protein
MEWYLLMTFKANNFFPLSFSAVFMTIPPLQKDKEGLVFQFCYQVASSIQKWKTNTNVLAEKTKNKKVVFFFLYVTIL